MLADRLKKTVSELRSLPAEEIVYWEAFLMIEREELRKARQ